MATNEMTGHNLNPRFEYVVLKVESASEKESGEVKKIPTEVLNGVVYSTTTLPNTARHWMDTLTMLGGYP